MGLAHLGAPDKLLAHKQVRLVRQGGWTLAQYVLYLGSGIPIPFGLNVNFPYQGFSRLFAVFKHFYCFFKHFLGAPKVKLYFHDSSRPRGKFKHFSRPVRTLFVTAGWSPQAEPIKGSSYIITVAVSRSAGTIRGVSAGVLWDHGWLTVLT